MMTDIESARRTLDTFFSKIFELCENHTSSPRINAVVAFDCCVVFTRNEGLKDKIPGLLNILEFIKQVNRAFIIDPFRPFMTTSSIAYGNFDYEDRAEVADIRKNYLFGRPYLSAVLDQKKGKPKIRPGECRLLARRSRSWEPRSNRQLSPILSRGKRSYFYWMLNDPAQQRRFEDAYREAYRNRKHDNYAGVVHVLQSFASAYIHRSGDRDSNAQIKD